MAPKSRKDVPDMPLPFPDVDHVVEIRQYDEEKCHDCAEIPSGMAGQMNHYLQKHDYVLLDIRTELKGDSEKPHGVKVALLGRPRKKPRLGSV